MGADRHESLVIRRAVEGPARGDARRGNECNTLDFRDLNDIVRKMDISGRLR